MLAVDRATCGDRRRCGAACTSSVCCPEQSPRWSAWLGRLPLLPALVAAGAGMLFGVMPSALTPHGSLWLSSCRLPKSNFLVRTMTVLEVGLLPSPLPRLCQPSCHRLDGSSCCPGDRRCAIAALSWVTADVQPAIGQSPHRAELRDSRDTPHRRERWPSTPCGWRRELLDRMAFLLVARLNDGVLACFSPSASCCGRPAR